jgi:hypothetical protein
MGYSLYWVGRDGETSWPKLYSLSLMLSREI